MSRRVQYVDENGKRIPCEDFKQDMRHQGSVCKRCGFSGSGHPRPYGKRYDAQQARLAAKQVAS